MPEFLHLTATQKTEIDFVVSALIYRKGWIARDVVREGRLYNNNLTDTGIAAATHVAAVLGTVEGIRKWGRDNA